MLHSPLRCESLCVLQCAKKRAESSGCSQRGHWSRYAAEAASSSGSGPPPPSRGKHRRKDWWSVDYSQDNHFAQWRSICIVRLQIGCLQRKVEIGLVCKEISLLGTIAKKFSCLGARNGCDCNTIRMKRSYQRTNAESPSPKKKPRKRGRRDGRERQFQSLASPLPKGCIHPHPTVRETRLVKKRPSLI